MRTSSENSKPSGNRTRRRPSSPLGVRVTTPTAPRGWTRELFVPRTSTSDTTCVSRETLSAMVRHRANAGPVRLVHASTELCPQSTAARYRVCSTGLLGSTRPAARLNGLAGGKRELHQCKCGSNHDAQHCRSTNLQICWPNSLRIPFGHCLNSCTRNSEIRQQASSRLYSVSSSRSAGPLDLPSDWACAASSGPLQPSPLALVLFDSKLAC
jgi:hypothetical protein